MRNVLSVLVYLCFTLRFGYGDIKVNHLKTLKPCDQKDPNGVASLDGILYVICEGFNIIKTYGTVKFEPKAPIVVNGLTAATDVLVHTPTKSLYVLQIANGANKVWHNVVRNGVVSEAWSSFDLPPNSTPLLHTTHPDWGETEKYVESMSYAPPMVYLRYPNGTLHANYSIPWTGDPMVFLNIIAIPNLGLYIATQTDRGWYFQLLTRNDKVEVSDIKNAADASCLSLNLQESLIEDFGYDNKNRVILVAQPKHKRLIGIYAVAGSDNAAQSKKLGCTTVSGFPNIAARRFGLDDQQRRIYVVDDVKQVQAFALQD